MTVALGAVTTDIIAKDEHLRSLATNVMKEIIELANDDIKDFYIDQNVDATKYFIDESHIDIMWKYTDEMGSYKTSSAIDLVNNTELEVEYIFTNVWNRAIYHSKKKCRALGMNDDKSFYPYIDHLMKMIHGINSIATKKRNLNIKWNATWWNGN
jgi:ketopantoate reductase